MTILNLIKRLIQYIIAVIWEAPQLCLAINWICCLYLMDCLHKFQFLKEENLILVFITDDIKPYSLGRFIFYPDNRIPRNDLQHEIGHCRQSQLLGPLYLFIITLPAIIWYYLKVKLHLFNRIDYNSFFTEAWATKLGTTKGAK